MNWLMLQKLEHREQRIALEELLGAVRQESERVERLEQQLGFKVTGRGYEIKRGQRIYHYKMRKA